MRGTGTLVRIYNEVEGFRQARIVRQSKTLRNELEHEAGLLCDQRDRNVSVAALLLHCCCTNEPARRHAGMI